MKSQRFLPTKVVTNLMSCHLCCVRLQACFSDSWSKYLRACGGLHVLFIWMTESFPVVEISRSSWRDFEKCLLVYGTLGWSWSHASTNFCVSKWNIWVMLFLETDQQILRDSLTGHHQRMFENFACSYDLCSITGSFMTNFASIASPPHRLTE